MAFATAAHGGLHGEGALVVLALFDLGVEDLHGLVGHVGGQTAATFAAGLAGGFDLVGGTPFGHGDVAEHGAGSVVGQVALDALGQVAGVVDGQFGHFVPAVQLVDHGGAFLAAPEQGIGRSSTVQGAADGAPVGDAALVGFQHAEGELVVRGAVFFAQQTDDAVEGTVTTGVALVPVTFIGHLGAFLGIQLVGLPAEFAVDLLEALGRSRRLGDAAAGTHQGCHGPAYGQTTEATQAIASAVVHISSFFGALRPL